MSKHYILGDILYGPASADNLGDYELAKVVHKYAMERKCVGGGGWRIRLPEITIEGIKVIPEFIGNANGLSLILYGIDVWMYKKKRLITMDSIFTYKPILYKKTYIEKRVGCEYEVDLYNTVLTKISVDISCMKFNKLEGVLYTADNLHPLVGGDGDGGGEGEECCVCLETTKTTTPCGHKLCVMCWGNIRMIRRRLPCPICRENLRQREKLAHLFPPGFVGLDNLYSDFYDHGGNDDGNRGNDLVGATRGGRITGIYNENTGTIIPIDGGNGDDDDSDDDSDDDNDLYFWEDYDGERGERGEDEEETDDNMLMRELVRVG
jgi:hypothetical protein